MWQICTAKNVFINLFKLFFLIFWLISIFSGVFMSQILNFIPLGHPCLIIMFSSHRHLSLFPYCVYLRSQNLNIIIHHWEIKIQKWLLQHICFCIVFGSFFCIYIYTVKPLITNTSEELIKCRLDNFSMSFILYYVNFSICENK